MTGLSEHLQSSVDAELARLLDVIAKASIQVRVEFPHRLGLLETENKYGETQQELDEWTNEFLTQEMLATDLVKTVYSEEAPPASGREDAPFVVAIDPLDGSSNVKTNNPCGTIVSVYKNKISKGKNQAAALYKLYGPVTTLVYTVGKGTHEFVKSRKGEVKFILSKENIHLPAEPKVIGVGGKKGEWGKPAPFLLELQEKLKTRYCGTMVADVNQVLHYGGLFAYPKAKLRLTYEAKPMAFIVEQAGGASSNGFKSLLDVEDDVDARTPVFLGNKEIIKEIEEMTKTL